MIVGPEGQDPFKKVRGVSGKDLSAEKHSCLVARHGKLSGVSLTAARYRVSEYPDKCRSDDLLADFARLGRYLRIPKRQTYY